MTRRLSIGVNWQGEFERETIFERVKIADDAGVDSVFVEVYVTLGGNQEFVGSAAGAVEVFWGIGVEESLDIAWSVHFNPSLMKWVLPYALYFTWNRDAQALSYDLVVYQGTGYDVPIEIIPTDGDLFGHHDPEFAGHVVVEDSLVVSLEEYHSYDELWISIQQAYGDWWGLARPIYAPGR